MYMWITYNWDILILQTNLMKGEIKHGKTSKLINSGNKKQYN